MRCCSNPLEMSRLCLKSPIFWVDRPLNQGYQSMDDFDDYVPRLVPDRTIRAKIRPGELPSPEWEDDLGVGTQAVLIVVPIRDLPGP